MCRARPSKTSSSAPHAVMSRAALAARATSAATFSSARTAARWRAAYGRSSSRSRITEASSGGTTYGSVAGNTVTRPASVLTTVHANVQVMTSTPATESRTISAWCVIRAQGVAERLDDHADSQVHLPRAERPGHCRRGEDAEPGEAQSGAAGQELGGRLRERPAGGDRGERLDKRPHR